jgi:transketolase
LRNAFFRELMAAAAQNDQLWFLCGDVGFSVIEPFQATYPDRFLNVGIAEQNMVGLAAGLALTGARAVVYSIGNFATLRCLEQIRDDVCAHHLPVTIVGTGAGTVYGTQGYTHHMTEDLAVTRALPGLTVFSPADPYEAAWAARAALTLPGPAYIRLAKAGEPCLHDAPLDALEVGRALRLTDGDDVTLCATGTLLETARDAALLLAAAGIKAGVVSFPCVSPLDRAIVTAEAARVRLVVTLEEHGLAGGFGESVGAVMAESGSSARLLRCGLDPRVIDGFVGTQAAWRDRMGLTPAAIATRIRAALQGN